MRGLDGVYQRLREEVERGTDSAGNKVLMVGQKYTHDDAIKQLESFIEVINSKWLDGDKDILEPQIRFPAKCLDNFLDHPFVFDLIKSETYDWEANDAMK